MFGFQWLFTWLLGTARNAVGSQLQAEMAVGAAVARAEFYAEAERAAAEFDAQNQPHLAAAIRDEVARLRAQEAGALPPPPPPSPPSAVLGPHPAPTAAALPAAPAALPRKPARKAAPPSPPPADPFAPPPAPWTS